MSKQKVIVQSPFLGLLTLMFIGLKLTGFIAWSWWWVLSPLLIPLAFAVCLYALAGVCFVIAAMVK